MTVYFIGCPSADLVRIGYTVDSLQKRFIHHRSMSPVPVELLGTVPGREKAEFALHQRFAHLRHHGDWFRLEGELAEFIAGIKPSGLKFSERAHPKRRDFSCRGNVPQTPLRRVAAA